MNNEQCNRILQLQCEKKRNFDCLRIRFSHGNESKERENHVQMQANCDQIPTYLTIDKIPGKKSRHLLTIEHISIIVWKIIQQRLCSFSGEQLYETKEQYAKFFLFRSSHCHVTYLSRDSSIDKVRSRFFKCLFSGQSNSVPAINLRWFFQQLKWSHEIANETYRFLSLSHFHTKGLTNLL